MTNLNFQFVTFILLSSLVHSSKLNTCNIISSAEALFDSTFELSKSKPETDYFVFVSAYQDDFTDLQNVMNKIEALNLPSFSVTFSCLNPSQNMKVNQHVSMVHYKNGVKIYEKHVELSRENIIDRMKEFVAKMEKSRAEDSITVFVQLFDRPTKSSSFLNNLMDPNNNTNFVQIIKTWKSGDENQTLKLLLMAFLVSFFCFTIFILLKSSVDWVDF